jgi:tetratricopeptide (TPR) repeat protein
MRSRSRRFAVHRVFLLSFCSALAAFSSAQEPSDAAPWNGPAFAADPAALLKASNAVPVPDGMSVVVLTEEVAFSFDATGRRDIRYRLVYRVVTPSGAKNWASYDESWSPWYQEKPGMRARVVTPDGQALDLDPATIADSPAGSSSSNIYTDRRVLRAPLPGVAVGAIVEEETVIHETRPVFDAGVVKYVFFGRGVPVQRVSLDVTYPKSLELRFLVRTKPPIEPKMTEAEGAVRLHFETGPLEAMDFTESAMPPDRAGFSYLALATGGSWAKVATRYSQIVEQQIAGADLAEAAADARKGDAATPEVIARLVERLQRDVRYTGVEFSDASIVPRTPAETLKRRYGDCKDKAALLVAMLRAARIPASVALLRSGSSLDSEKDLPGLGFFDHAIVYVPGPPVLWIDPTDEFARAGELPLADRGRLALIAAPGSAGLVPTPESLSADNGIVETREFFLQEYGPARVAVTFDFRGSLERAYRRYLRQTEKKKVDEYFEKYVRNNFLANGPPKMTLPDPLDVKRPLRIRLDLDEARRGQTDDSAAVVAIMASGIADSFPSVFREASEEAKPGKAANAGPSGPKPRKHDFVFGEPAVYDWIYRVVPPPGYAAAPPPENEETAIGTAKLTKRFAVEKDGTVTAALHLDTGKTRISPKEFNELREAVRKLQSAEPILVRFDSRGQSSLAAGRLREALAEFRNLSCVHPKEAIHAIQTANALLVAGLGEAAKEEARRAVSLDASSARAYRTLGWALQHDDLGRRFGRGFDRKGALAAYEKGLELDPSDVAMRADYAILLEHDDHGLHYAAGANVGEAVDQYRILRKDWKETQFDDRLLLALIWARRFSEAIEAARDAAPSETREPAVILATAATQGSAAAIREAPRLVPDAEKRRKALLDASETLFLLRLYKEGVALMRQAANGASNAAALQARAEMFARARRFEEVPILDDDPRGAVQRWIIAAATARAEEEEKARSLYSPRVTNEAFEATGPMSFAAVLESIQRPFRKEGFPLEAAADLLLASTELAVEGSGELGYRVRVVGARAGDADSLFFVVRENGNHRLIATSRNFSPVGRQVLWLAEKGDLAAARQWLDWVRDEITPPKPDDPFLASCLPIFWRKGSAGDARAVRRAAACLLAPSNGSETAISVLKADREAATSDAERGQDDWGSTLAYLQGKKYAEMLEAVTRVSAAHPESETVFRLHGSALIYLHRRNEAKTFAEDRLRRFPDDAWALRMKADLAAFGGDLATYQKTYRRLSESGKAEASDFNNVAWMTLFTGDEGGRGLRDALRAVDLSQHGDSGSLHTLATLYAESGKTGEARETIMQALELDESSEPESAIWCVFGRIAQEYGEYDVAKKFYERVAPPETRESDPYSAYALAKKHLDTLSKEKSPQQRCVESAPGAASAAR